MSSNYYKTEYEVEGPYGTTQKKILYCQDSATVDKMYFKDESGELIFVVEEWSSNDMFKAIERLYRGEGEEISRAEYEDIRNKYEKDNK